MSKRTANAKIIVEVESNRQSGEPCPIRTVSVFDNRENSYWNSERIHERGIERFIDLADVKETLNWNLNGDGLKYRFKWGQSSKTKSTGYAYIFA